MTIYEKLKMIIKKIYDDNLFKNSTYLIVTNFSYLVLGFFFWVISTRYYTPEDIGEMSAILSSISIISMISSIGLPMSLVYYLPRYREHASNIINTCLIIVIGLTIILSIIFISGIGTFIPELESVFRDFEISIIFIITTMAMAISVLMSSIFTAGRRSSYHMIKENFSGSLRIILLLVFIGFGAYGILLSWSVGIIAAVILGFFLLFKLWNYHPRIILDPIIKDMAKFSIEVYITGMLFNIPRLVFPIIIVNTISKDAAGYFFIAITMASLLYGIPSSIASSFMAESSDKEKFWHNVNKAIKFNLIILIPGVLGFMIFGKFVLNIFNPAYVQNSMESLNILSLTSIPMSIIIIYGIIQNAQKKIIETIKINGTVVIVTLLLSYYFITIWNIEGIAISYLVANMIVAIYIIFKIKQPIKFSHKILRQI